MKSAKHVPVVWAALVLIGATWISAVPMYFVFHPATKVVTRLEAPPAVTESTTVEEVIARLGEPQTRVPANQINESLGGVCDIWQSSTWVVLLCHN